MIKKLFFMLAVISALSSCQKESLPMEHDGVAMMMVKKNDKNKDKDKKNKKTYTIPLEVEAQDGASSATRAYDGDLNWHWEYGDALLGYQVAVDKIRNRLEYNLNTGLFACSDFTYQSSSKARFHFVYPYGAEYQKGQLRPTQDGIWRPVAVTTTEETKVTELPTLQFEQLSSALELRIWNKDNTAMQERVVSAELTSDSDFVANWTLDEETMTYTQSLSGKEIIIEDINTSVVQINMPHLPEGYPSDVKIQLVLTREDGKTMTTILPQDLTYVKQMRTVYNMIFVPDPTFTCATYNVDGLPLLINSNGPGSSGTKTISKKLAASGWDFIGFQEDFEYHSNLASSMGMYAFGKHRGSVGIGNLVSKAVTNRSATS